MIMKKKIIGAVIILLVAVAAASYLLRDKPVERPENPARNFAVPILPEAQVDALPSACGTPDCKTVVAAVKIENQDESAGKDDIYKMFQADGRDNLILNENTRLNIEKLYALDTPEERAEKLQKISRALPDTAHRQLINLV